MSTQRIDRILCDCEMDKHIATSEFFIITQGLVSFDVCKKCMPQVVLRLNDEMDVGDSITIVKVFYDEEFKKRKF